MVTKEEMLFQLLQKLDQNVEDLHRDMAELKISVRAFGKRIAAVEEVQENCPAKKRAESYTVVVKDVYILASMVVAVLTYLTKVGVIKW